MKRFLLKLSLFILPLLLVNVLLFGWLFLREKKRYESDLTIRGNETIIVCGDSQTEVSLDPAVFPELFNASLSGQEFCYTATKTLDCVRLNRGKVRVALIPVNINRIGRKDFDAAMPFYRHQLIVPWMHGRFVRTEDCLNALTNRLRTREIGYGGFVRRDVCGFETNPGKMVDYADEIAARVNEELGEYEFESGLYVETLKGVLDALRKEEITTVLISTPLHPMLRSRITKFDLFNDAVKKIATESDCLWFNYVDLPFSDNEFADVNHLNATGAEKFSKRVRTDLQSLGLLPFD